MHNQLLIPQNYLICTLPLQYLANKFTTSPLIRLAYTKQLIYEQNWPQNLKLYSRIDRDPGKIPVPVKIGLFAGIPVPVKIVKFTGIPTGILISNFWKIQLNFLEFFNIFYKIFGFYKILFYKIF